jgi:hypothetical protein
MAKSILQEVATLNAELFNKIDIQQQVEDLKILNKVQLKKSNEILSYNISQNNINLAKYLQETEDKVIFRKLQTDEIKIKIDALEDIVVDKISEIEYNARKERRIFLRNNLKRVEDIEKITNNTLEYFTGPIMVPKLDANRNFVNWDTETLIEENSRNWIYINSKDIKYKGFNIIKAGIDDKSNRITIGDASNHNETFIPKDLIVYEDINVQTGNLIIVTDTTNDTKTNSIEVNRNIRTEGKLLSKSGLKIDAGNIDIDGIGSLTLSNGDITLLDGDITLGDNGDINLSENGDINLDEGNINSTKGSLTLTEGSVLLEDKDKKIEIKDDDDIYFRTYEGVLTSKTEIKIPEAFKATDSILESSGTLKIDGDDESIIAGSLKLAKALTVTTGNIDVKAGGMSCTGAITSTTKNITSEISGNFEVGQKSDLHDTDITGDLNVTKNVDVTKKFTCSGSGSKFTSGLTVEGELNATANRAKYADVAEMYLTDKYYDKGTVLSHCSDDYECILFNELNPIMGVVSSAPGYLLNSEAGYNSIHKYVPIALTGRVPVKTKCTIRKGQHIIGDINNPGFCKEGPFKSPYYIGVSLSSDIDGLVEVKV